MTQAEVLFDGKEYETDPRLRIPEFLGRKPGEFIDTWRYVKVLTEFDERHIFVPGEEGSQFTAHEYAVDSENFRNDFTAWREKRPSTTSYEGYLVGFPQLYDVDATKRYDCLHIWTNNSDVMTGCYAIPLNSLTGLYMFSKQFTAIRVDMDEVAMGDAESRYEIPFARDRKTGEFLCRVAQYEDLEEVLQLMDELPVRIFGAYDGVLSRNFLNHSFLLQFLNITDTEMVDEN